MKAFVLTVLAHAAVLALIVVVSHAYVVPLPESAWRAAPLPPPPPAPPTEFTDPRLFPSADPYFAPMYSSLPPSVSGSRMVRGVGIEFSNLPDIGYLDSRHESVRRTWPGQELEANITRRAIPKFPEVTLANDGVVSVFLEYLVGTDGSVKVLRALGPPPFVASARTALERWEYRPVRFRNHVIEVMSRVESPV